MGRCNPSRPGNRGGIRRHWAQGPTSLASGAYQRCVPGARRTLASAVLAGALLAVLSPVQAESEQWLDTLEGIHPYASLSYTDDSNLLRISDEGADIVGIDSRSDQYVTTEAGIDTSFDLSRQRISIDGRVYHNAYDRFSQFDHTGGDAKVAVRQSLGW